MVWLYNGEEFTEEQAEGYYGFVYLITNLITGQKYVGRKYFTRRNRKKQPNSTRKKVVVSQSDWKDYWGSSKILHADIEKYGKENFKREILSLHEQRRDVNYQELVEQVERKVLEKTLENGLPEYYNENIMLRFYRKKK